MEWKPQNHNTVYVAVFFVFLRGGPHVSAESGTHREGPPTKFGQHSWTDSYQFGCQMLSNYRVSIEQYLLGFQKLAPPWFQGAGFLASRGWTSAMTSASKTPNLGARVDMESLPELFFCKSGGSYIAQINWFMNNISEASTHQF